MPTIQLQGGSYRWSVEFTGLQNELVVDESNRDLVLHDGVTQGGFRFLNIVNADARYQARSEELDGLLEFEPENRGFLARRGPADYRIRTISVNGDQLEITNADGYGGNPTIGLKAIIVSEHEWTGKQTFTGGVEGDVTGDTTGTHTGDVVGNVTGNTTGEHTGAVDTRGETLLLDEEQIPLSALDAATQGRLIPVGVILMWSGTAATIPDGWLLCDGTSGTPDLRDRFVMGAGGGQAPGSTGGSAAISLAGAISESGAHNHAITVANQISGVTLNKVNGAPVAGGGTQVVVRDASLADPGHTHVATTQEGSGAHTHDLDLDDASTIPPFLALCYIMKAA